jgi:SNF2 family DNA or RNA helicase
MMNISVEGKKIIFRFKFNPALVQQCRDIKAKWNKEKKHWWLSDNLVNRKAVNVLYPDTFHIQELKPDPDYRPPKYLMEHQLNNVRTAWKKRRHGYGDDTGTGKTLTGIEIIKMYNRKTLVICPRTLIKSAWIEEDIRKFAPELYPVTLNMWSARKRRSWRSALENYQIGVINPESFKASLKDIETYFKPEVVILDESTIIKSPDSDITKKFTKFAENIPAVYLMSGTPAPSGDHEYYTQCNVIMPGIFGSSYYTFKKRYFRPKGEFFVKYIDNFDESIIRKAKLESSVSSCFNSISAKIANMEKTIENIVLFKGIFESATGKQISNSSDASYLFELFQNRRMEIPKGGANAIELIPEREQEFKEKVSQCWTAVRKRDVLDLPEETHIKRFFEMGKPEKKAYEEMKEFLSVETENGSIDAKNVLVKAGKLRQITSGFLFDDEHNVAKIGNSKLEAFAELISEIGTQQVVIFAEYIPESLHIAEYFRQENKTFGLCNGSVTPKQQDENIAAFKAGELQYIVAHPKTMQTGHTLTNASYMVFYTFPYSPFSYIQAKGRTMRKGQTENCSYYYLLCENTADEQVYSKVINGEQTGEVLLKYLSK